MFLYYLVSCMAGYASDVHEANVAFEECLSGVGSLSGIDNCWYSSLGAVGLAIADYATCLANLS